ncbi:imelysin family protein [Pseudoteredinibacter isoporae]|uniref:imelysin family protein n=1 Tax=Pseudoteredinibacter isoporae TaxID=570281 RepID=UPI00310A68DE
MKNIVWRSIIAVWTALLLIACDRQLGEEKAEAVSVPEQVSSPVLSRDQEMQLKKAVAEYWRDVRAAATQNRQNLSKLQEVVAEFLRDPTAERLDESKVLWLENYRQYQALNVVRNFPRAAPNVFADQGNIWLAIDPYPIAIGFIDEFGPYKNVGIVHDHTVEMSEVAIRAQHAITDESEAVLGFMPMAFLLWGDGKTSEQRVVDFSVGSEAKPVQRRRKLLELNSLAISNDAAVLESWLGDTGPIDVLFYRLPVIAQLELIKQATAATIENNILLALNDVGQEDWRPHQVWPAVFSSQLTHLREQLKFLAASGLNVGLLSQDLMAFVAKPEEQTGLQYEALSAEQSAQFVDELHQILNAIRVK